MYSRRIVLPVSTSPESIASTPSRRSASANFASPLTWCCTSSLKLLVLAIFVSLSAYAALASFVVLPIGDRRVDVALLPLLRAARQQDQQCVPVAPEIDSVSRPEIDLVFQHALADGFYVGEIALLHPGDNASNLGARYRVQIREPFSERLAAIRSHVITNLEHNYG